MAVSNHLNNSETRQTSHELPVNQDVSPSAATPGLNTNSVLQRAKIDPKSLKPGEIIQLQKTIGNRAVMRLLNPHSSDEPVRNKGPQTQPQPPSIQRQYETRTEPDVFDGFYEMFAGKSLNWHAKLAEIYEHIGEVRKVLEDDEDQAALDKIEKTIDENAKQLDVLTEQFSEAETFSSGRPRRSTASSPGHLAGVGKSNREYSADSGPSKKRRFDTEVEEPAPKTELVESIHDGTIFLGKELDSLKKTFSLNTGGFSAKGRAHDLGEVEKATHGHDAVTTFFENIKLDSDDLSRLKKVFKKRSMRKKIEEAGKPQMPFIFTDPKKPDQTVIEALEEKLDPLNPTHAPAPFIRAPRSMDRGGGQLKNMNGVNASAYAELSKVPDWENSRWEWLHIRAASLGGATDGTNLVVGTRDANTHMMPFEANIRAMANLVSENRDMFKHLTVRFLAQEQHPKAKHKVKKIVIEWKLSKADAAGPRIREAEGVAHFNPLNTTDSISKTEVAILEHALKEKREEVLTEKEDEDMPEREDVDSSEEEDVIMSGS